jgi:octaprenyl-diphosphate synthase
LLATCLYQAAFSSNIEIIKVVSQLGQDLSEGELLQLSNVSNIEISEPVYFDIIRKKTAALFSACTLEASTLRHSLT